MSEEKTYVIAGELLRVTSTYSTEWYPVSRIVGVDVSNDKDRGEEYWTVRALLTEGKEVRLLRDSDRAMAEQAAGEFVGKVFG